MNKLDYPSRIVLELTPLCNLTCSMCPRHIIDKNNGYMKDILFKKLIDEIYLKSKDIKVLPFWRGESLLHKKFKELSLYALEKDIKLHISTNGHYVEGEKSQVLSKYEFITFSIHTKEGFKKAVEFTKKYKTDKNTIQISFVDCEDDMIPLLDKTIESKELLGFDSVRLYEEHTKEGKFGFSGKGIIEPRVFCPKLDNSLVVAYDGSISRCNHIWNSESDNVNEKTIQDIWNGEILNNIRKNYPDNLCTPCDQWSGRTNGKLWTKQNSKIVKVSRGN